MNATLFNSMTRRELRYLARQAKVPQGKTKQIIVNNLLQAVSIGKLKTKFLAYVYTVGATPEEESRMVYLKNLSEKKSVKIPLTPTKS
jgi:hypothetical protein